MKRIKWGQRIAQLWIVLFLIENFYFGWNKVAVSGFETDCDIALSILLYIGVVVYLSPLLDLYERAVLKNYVEDAIRIHIEKKDKD